MAKRHGVREPKADRGTGGQEDVRVVTTGVQDSDLERMFALSEHWERLGDNRSIFLRCYAMMTENMLCALGNGRFDDVQWVSALLRNFASYYFDALEEYEQGCGGTPKIWVHAHDATRERDLFVLQHLALGINAHINFDLVFALNDMLLPEWNALPPHLRRQRRDDHQKVNTIIAETVDAVQDSLVERHVPWLDLVDDLFGPVDEFLVSRMIANWRDEVWEQAVTMVEAPDSETRDALRSQVEVGAMRRAHILAP
jgi:hypothetical protein